MLRASDGDLTSQSDSLPSSVSVHVRVSVQEGDAPCGIMYSTVSLLSQLSDFRRSTRLLCSQRKTVVWRTHQTGHHTHSQKGADNLWLLLWPFRHALRDQYMHLHAHVCASVSLRGSAWSNRLCFPRFCFEAAHNYAYEVVSWVALRWWASFKQSLHMWNTRKYWDQLKTQARTAFTFCPLFSSSFCSIIWSLRKTSSSSRKQCCLATNLTRWFKLTGNVLRTLANILLKF